MVHIYPIIAVVSIALFLIVFYKNFFIKINDPNVGVVYYLGAIVEESVLTPGFHFLVQNIGRRKINEVVIMPGREFREDISVDVIYTQNVKVVLDVRLVLQLQLRRRFPTTASAINLASWQHVSPGETLFSYSDSQGNIIPGTLNIRLSSMVKNAASQVIMKYDPALVTSSPQVFEELVQEIRDKVWAQISHWAGKLEVEIEDIYVPDEVTRTKVRLDAQAQAQAMLTEQEAELAMDIRYREVFGDSAANARIVGRSFTGNTFNVFSDGLGGLFKTLTSIDNTKEIDVTAPVPRRVVRRRRRR
ncbi:MAG: hypothetical protein QG628_997 [Patescibacteria group bacterium]|nr:hypothetical protein [Patescibacteria group bacterium]